MLNKPPTSTLLRLKPNEVRSVDESHGFVGWSRNQKISLRKWFSVCNFFSEFLLGGS